MGKKKRIGDCPLCNTSGVALSRSHFFARFSYEQMGPAPIRISASGAKKLSEQFVHPMFCHECEGKLNTNGEQYVEAVGYGAAAFPLYDTLRNQKNFRRGPAIRGYALSDFPTIRADALSYFALSIVYRASIWSQIDAALFKVSLSAEVQESIRKYLNLENTIPKLSAIQVIVIDPPENPKLPDFRAMSIFPYSRSPDPTLPLDFSAYAPIEFAVAGLLFNVTVGEQVPQSVLDDSLHPGGRIFRVPSNQLSINERTLRLLEVSNASMIWTPRGPHIRGLPGESG